MTTLVLCPQQPPSIINRKKHIGKSGKLATFGCYAVLGAPRTHGSSSFVGQKAGPCSRPRRFAFCLVFSLITKARREATRARNKPKKR